MEAPQSTHSPVEERLGCFRVLAIMNKIAVNSRAGFHADISFKFLQVNIKECDCWITMLTVGLFL